MDLLPCHIVHRVGDVTVESLRLKKAEGVLNPPGISVLIGGTPEEAAQQMRLAFPHIRKWQSGSLSVASATVEQIRAAGYDVVAIETANLPNHGRIVHALGVQGFVDEALSVLLGVFAIAEDC